jgi:hypothetical protein
MPTITKEPTVAQYLTADMDTHTLHGVGGGPPRIRKDRASQRPRVRLSWNCNALEFAVLASAYRSERHAIWYITFYYHIGSGYAQHACVMVPDTFEWVPDGARYVVTAEFMLEGEVQ